MISSSGTVAFALPALRVVSLDLGTVGCEVDTVEVEFAPEMLRVEELGAVEVEFALEMLRVEELALTEEIREAFTSADLSGLP